MNSIEQFFNKYSFLGTYILRYGVGFVFMWFGWSGISNTDMWVRLVPEWTAFAASPQKLVVIHGIFELVFGLLLFTGFYTRIVALILAIDMLHIISLVSGATQIRDIGLEAALLAIVFYKE